MVKPSLNHLLGRGAEIGNDTALTFWPARFADVTTMQNQPVMRMLHEFFRDDFFQSQLDFEWCFAKRQRDTV